MIIELLKVIFLGIIEGITEWLPVSSTGHLILADEFIHLNVSDAFLQMFLVVIQLGAILAVVVLYWNRLWPFQINSDESGIFKFCNKEKWILWFKIFVACLPAIIIGFPLNDFLEEHLNNYVVVALMLILYGVLFIFVENNRKKLKKKAKVRSLKRMDFLTALKIGLFQVLALIPGTSRSGATIIGGMLAGTNRTVAAEFTFFLAIPVMFGASLLKLLKFGLAFSAAEVTILLTGMLVSFLVSVLSIKFLMGYIKKNDFKVFGYYRIVLGIIVLVYFAIKNLLFA